MRNPDLLNSEGIDVKADFPRIYLIDCPAGIPSASRTPQMRETSSSRLRADLSFSWTSTSSSISFFPRTRSSASAREPKSSVSAKAHGRCGLRNRTLQTTALAASKARPSTRLSCSRPSTNLMEVSSSETLLLKHLSSTPMETEPRLSLISQLVELSRSCSSCLELHMKFLTDISTSSDTLNSLLTGQWAGTNPQQHTLLLPRLKLLLMGTMPTDTLWKVSSLTSHT